MALFKQSKKQQVGNVEQQLREKINKSFEDEIDHLINKDKSMMQDPLFGPLLLQSGITNLSKELKKSSELDVICSLNGINYQKLVDEECNKILNKYLEL